MMSGRRRLMRCGLAAGATTGVLIIGEPFYCKRGTNSTETIAQGGSKVVVTGHRTPLTFILSPEAGRGDSPLPWLQVRGSGRVFCPTHRQRHPGSLRPTSGAPFRQPRQRHHDLHAKTAVLRFEVGIGNFAHGNRFCFSVGTASRTDKPDKRKEKGATCTAMLLAVVIAAITAQAGTVRRRGRGRRWAGRSVSACRWFHPHGTPQRCCCRDWCR
jgi:hypothetical protein